MILELFIAAQGFVVIGVALVLLLWDNSGQATISALAAGGSVWSANVLMVIWMRARRYYLSGSATANALSILTAYVVKLALSCALLLASVLGLPSMHGPGFLLGLCFALTSIYFVPLVSRSPMLHSIGEPDFNQRARAIAAQAAGLPTR